MLKKLFIATLFMTGCTGIPSGIEPVKDFDIHKYLGKWYEIARLDHSFERGLLDVTADYSIRDDGGIRVINRGYDSNNDSWKQVEGRAYFLDKEDVGRIKVSFFGPFYGSYNIIALDLDAYSYALVCGNSRDYLWILARQPKLDEGVLDKLLAKAQSLGFDTDKFIYPQRKGQDK